MNSVNLHGVWWQVTRHNLTRFSLFTNTSTSTFGSSPTFSLRSNPSEKVAIILQTVENTRCHKLTELLILVKTNRQIGISGLLSWTQRPRFKLKGVSKLRIQIKWAEDNILVLVKGDRHMRSQVDRDEEKYIGFG